MNMLATEECAHSDWSPVERLIAIPNVKKKKKKPKKTYLLLTGKKCAVPESCPILNVFFYDREPTSTS